MLKWLASNQKIQKTGLPVPEPNKRYKRSFMYLISSTLSIQQWSSIQTKKTQRCLLWYCGMQVFLHSYVEKMQQKTIQPSYYDNLILNSSTLLQILLKSMNRRSKMFPYQNMYYVEGWKQSGTIFDEIFWFK